MGPYSLKEGITFQRRADGAVRIEVRDSEHVGSPIVREVVVSAAEWASTVAAVSERGESGESYQAALDFHGAG